MTQIENNIHWEANEGFGKDIGFFWVVLCYISHLRGSSHCEGFEQSSHRANMPGRSEERKGIGEAKGTRVKKWDEQF